MDRWSLITGLLAEAAELPLDQRRDWLKAEGHPQDITGEALALLHA